MTEPQPPKYTALLPCRWGWFVGLSNDSFQTGSVYTQGEWAPIETSILAGAVPLGGTVLDVGANVGSLTLAFASMVGHRGKVYSFEPQPYCYLCLCANVALNSLMHVVRPMQVAVGDTIGTIQVPVVDPRIANNFGGVSLLEKTDSPTEEVPVLTIDSMELPACHLLKIDVEGMEPAVLRGAEKTIAKHRPVLWFEMLAHRDTESQLLEIVQKHGYKAWKVGTQIYSDHNTRMCRFNGFVMPDGTPMQDNNIFAIPKDREAPDWATRAEVFV